MTALSELVEEATVGISGVLPTTEEAAGYPALVRTDMRWNGWEVPYFTRATVDRIVADTATLLAEYGPDTVEAVRWDGDTVVIVAMAGTEEEYTERITAVDIDGTPHWGVGGFAWTWESWE